MKIRIAGAIALLALTFGMPSRAWCAENLWTAYSDGPGITSLPSSKLKKSGTPKSTLLSTFEVATGLAFDESNNLWAVVNNDEVVEFTAAQLKNLKTDPNPTPGVIITSTSTFDGIFGCNFDAQGNLWIPNYNSDSICELSKAELEAGSADLTPAIVISSSDLFRPGFITFDAAGNAWVNSEADFIAEFSASQLTSSGMKTPAVILADDGSGTSLDDSGEIVFDSKGNLWVSNYLANTVVEYTAAQIATSGDPTPNVKLTSSDFNFPWGAAFDAAGNLWIADYADSKIHKFTAKQLKAGGAQKPKVSVTGSFEGIWQMVFGPAS